MPPQEWTVHELLNADEPLVADYTLARQVVGTLSEIEHSELDVRVPVAAREFAQNSLTAWFEAIAEIERTRGNYPYLINRELYPEGSTGEPDWDQGLRREDLEIWLGDSEFMEDYQINSPLVRMNEVTQSDEPFLGYYNRIFPLKFVLRTLAALSLNNVHEGTGSGVSLESLREHALQHATYARDTLKILDVTYSAWKGAEITVGFPERNNKAAERFVAQFVGSRRKKSVSGALVEMGFVNMPDLGFGLGIPDENVSFTKIGWLFAMLPNPIIDRDMEGVSDYRETRLRFSEQEIELLLAHFQKNTPAEWKFLRTISELIHSGSNRPTSLEAGLKEAYEWDSTKVSQMRNGALSRMEELCLLTRNKEGRKVTYSLTELCMEKFELS